MIDKFLIGRVIQNLRISRNLTQEELSLQAGISKNHLSKVERGISVLNTEAFLKMAQILNFTLEDFGVKTAHYSGMPESKQELIKRILYSSEREVRAYVKLLDTMQSIVQTLR